MAGSTRTMLRTASVLVVLGLGQAPLPAGEASSANYIMETSGMTMAGGVSASQNFSVTAAVGVGVEGGEMTSASFNAELGIINGLDADGDGVSGADDVCPTEYSGCFDLDLDGCIDQPDADADMDGVTAGSCDCDDAEGSIWDTPGEAQSLLLFNDDPIAGMTLSWAAPAEPGGTLPRYDAIRSTNPDDFVTAATCVGTDVGGTLAFDVEDPGTGGMFFYVVRAENDCVAGVGSLGTSQGLYARSARDCS